MSSRPSGYYNSRSSYRDRDADAGRRRSRSPEERGSSYRSRDGDRRRDDGAVDREGSGGYRRREDDDIHRRDGKAPPRSPERKPQPPHRPAPPAGPRHTDAQRNAQDAQRTFPTTHAPPFPRTEQNRPLDRRAIEQGRREREMERAERVQRELEARDRSRSPTRSPEREPYRRPRPAHPDSDAEEGASDEGEEDAEAAAMAAMGFGGFGTTKGKHREGNAEGGANIKKERTWRQYMNRRGGFNRPLDPVKEKKKK
ncbi:hypothetical protein QFC20_005836 [Naganishia adeliensis]|uniref:Uncharacterized protein n=1 Tax=Naganishia adeliensis TaxID=92952 RepID=A0ACC2VJZ0_9TREE|nr:hypothetical protein QFC20_005836 [Naganishia adeliensis]